MYNLEWPDYAIFVVILISYACVGLWFGYSYQIMATVRRIFQKKVHQHVSKEKSDTADVIFLGNRSLSLLPVIGSSLASFLSAVTLLGVNADVYLYGIEFGILIIGYVIAFPIVAEIFAPVFYSLNLSSSNEYLEMRFGKTVRGLVTFVFIIQMIVYISVVLYAPSLALSQATGWNMSVAIILTGILATFYTAIGGIKAVVWTDLIQVIVMLIGFIMIVAFGSTELGGILNVIHIAKNGHRLDLFNFDPSPLLRHSFFSLAIGGTGMMLSIYATNQAQVQRYIACKNLTTAKKAIYISMPLNAVFLVLQILGGLVAYATFVGCDPKLNGEITAYDQVLPYLILKLFHQIPVIRGIFISSIFAAALSTLSSGINSVACVLVEDVLVEVFVHCRRGVKLRPKTLTLIARIFAFIIGALTIMMAFIISTVPSGILEISYSIFGSVGGPILTLFSIGMLMPFVNKWGALLGFLSSLTTGLTMAIGSLFHATYKQTVLIPVNDVNCAASNLSSVLQNTRFNASAAPDNSINLFNLSYLYYCPLCFIVGVLVASVVSVLTGMSTKVPVSKSLLAWQAVSLYAHLPNCISPQSCDTVVTSKHEKKMAIILSSQNMEVEIETDCSVDSFKTIVSEPKKGIQ